MIDLAGGFAACLLCVLCDFQAYRLEPLILKHYSNIAPIQIHWYKKNAIMFITYTLLIHTHFVNMWDVCCFSGVALLTPRPMMRSGLHTWTRSKIQHLTRRASPARARLPSSPAGTTESLSPAWARPAYWVRPWLTDGSSYECMYPPFLSLSLYESYKWQ